MNKRKGYIKLYRSIWDNPIIAKDSDHLSVWIYLLTNATHSEMDVIFGNERVKLRPGQLVTGRKIISKKTKVNESKVTRILKLFKIEQQIEQQTNSQGSLISIINWDRYQLNEQQNEQRVNNDRTTSEQRVNTNNNVKNEKRMINNDKKEYVRKPIVEERLSSMRARIKEVNERRKK